MFVFMCNLRVSERLLFWTATKLANRLLAVLSCSDCAYDAVGKIGRRNCGVCEVECFFALEGNADCERLANLRGGSWSGKSTVTISSMNRRCERE
jgi:hypothetical protein